MVAHGLAELKEELEKSGHKSRGLEVAKIEADYVREKAHLSQRAEMTEDLAGVGLSVETASHDIMLLMSRAQEIGKRVARVAGASGGDEIREQADMLLGVLQQIMDGMQDVQSLFKSSRRRRTVLRVEPVLDRIHGIYKTLLEQRSLRYRKVIVGSSPLTANTTDGVVMQVLINLFDNASYWLHTVDTVSREIRVTVDGRPGGTGFLRQRPRRRPAGPAVHFRAFLLRQGAGGTGSGPVHWPASYWSGTTTASRPRRSTGGFCRAPTSSSAS